MPTLIKTFPCILFMVWWGHYWYLREHVSHKLSRFPAHFSYEPQIGWYLAGTCPGRKCWDNTTVIDLLIYILWLVRERADEFKMRVIFKIDKVAIDTVQSVEWGPSIGMGWKNAFTIYQSTSRAALRTPFGVLFPLCHLNRHQDHCLTRTTNTFLLFFLVMPLQRNSVFSSSLPATHKT